MLIQHGCDIHAVTGPAPDIDRNDDQDQVNYGNCNALHVLALARNSETSATLTKVLISKGVNPLQRDASDLLFINLAAAVGNIAVLGYMGDVGGGIPERLGNNMSLMSGQQLTSADGRWKLIYQPDGQLLGYTTDSNHCFWSSGKILPGLGLGVGLGVDVAPADRVHMKSDGNLVCINTEGIEYWSSNTANRGRAPYRLVLQDDRNIAIYDSRLSKSKSYVVPHSDTT